MGKRSLPFPLWMLALDVIGTLLVGFGIFGLSGGFMADAASLTDMQAISIAVIVFGVLLMLPLVITVVRKGTGGGGSG